jgi:hypothetical protein
MTRQDNPQARTQEQFNRLIEFRLEGTSLTFITSDESALCAGQTGSYQVELTEQGQLQFELEEDPCQERAIHHSGSWSRYEP